MLLRVFQPNDFAKNDVNFSLVFLIKVLLIKKRVVTRKKKKKNTMLTDNSKVMANPDRSPDSAGNRNARGDMNARTAVGRMRLIAKYNDFRFIVK